MDDNGDTWDLSTEVRLTQTDFGIKPISLLMGLVKVTDEVTVDFRATHRGRPTS